MKVIKLIIFCVLIFSLTSCFYSVKYIAVYNIDNKNNTKTINEVSKQIINNLSDRYNLSIDDKYKNSDTIGYFGKPYHYFKFIINQKNNTGTITLDYYGVYGSRKNPPYKKLLSNLSDTIKLHFNVINEKIYNQSNEKLKK